MTETPLKLVLFDVDGTLVDSQGRRLSAACRVPLIPLSTLYPLREEILSIVGLSLPVAMARLAPDLDMRSCRRGLSMAIRTAYSIDATCKGRRSFAALSWSTGQVLDALHDVPEYAAWGCNRASQSEGWMV